MSYSRYLTAFVIVFFIFIFGVILGSNIAVKKTSALDLNIHELQVEIESKEVAMNLLTEDLGILCSMAFDEITRNRVEMAKKYVQLEKELGKTHPEVLSKKDEYFLIQAKEYLLAKRMQTECEKEIKVILYFYSNYDDCPKCQAQGYILDDIYQQNREKIIIYSFDIHSNNTIVETLKKQYKIHTPPAITINQQTINGYIEKAEIQKKIDE